MVVYDSKCYTDGIARDDYQLASNRLKGWAIRNP
jgi:hypothetical protein